VFAAELPGNFSKIDLSVMAAIKAEAVDLQASIYDRTVLYHVTPPALRSHDFKIIHA
jgi:hypothetical protein